MQPWIAISLGDVTGIGPEVTLKAVAAEAGADHARYLLIGDEEHTKRLNKQLGLDLRLESFGANEGAGRVFLFQPGGESLPEHLAAGAPEAARAAVAWLEEGARRCLGSGFLLTSNGEGVELGGMGSMGSMGSLLPVHGGGVRGEGVRAAAFVTAPVNKESIVRSGISFVGQTEFLSQLAGAERTAMMLLGQDDRQRWLRVVLATTHVPLKLVSERLTRAKIELAIELAAQACHDLELPRARIGVCGLNPHAGEGGAIGTEEQTTIGPAVLAMRQRNMDVTGPVSADALFYHAYRGSYDAVVAMYHDQGLAPLKMVAFESGVNWTLGLPFIRTSPDHGTAYDIAGQGKANPSSMVAAIRLAKQLAARRRG